MPQSFNFKQLQNSLPKRPKDSHKRNFGKVFICAGSAGMGGAGILASETSLFCGSGLVKLTTDKSNVKAALSRNPEVMTAGINMGNDINVQSFKTSFLFSNFNSQHTRLKGVDLLGCLF